MPLQTDPTAFSITALLSDQVALIARHEGVSPGAAAQLLRQLMDRPGGRRQLLKMIERELRNEANPAEARKIAVVRKETADWVADLDERTGAAVQEAAQSTADAVMAAMPPHARRMPAAAIRPASPSGTGHRSRR